MKPANLKPLIEAAALVYKRILEGKSTPRTIASYVGNLVGYTDSKGIKHHDLEELSKKDYLSANPHDEMVDDIRHLLNHPNINDGHDFKQIVTVLNYCADLFKELIKDPHNTSISATQAEVTSLLLTLPLGLDNNPLFKACSSYFAEQEKNHKDWIVAEFEILRTQPRPDSTDEKENSANNEASLAGLKATNLKLIERIRVLEREKERSSEKDGENKKAQNGTFKNQASSLIASLFTVPAAPNNSQHGSARANQTNKLGNKKAGAMPKDNNPKSNHFKIS